MSNRIAIVDGIRTPFCKAFGQLMHFEADDLGAFCVRELLARLPLSPGEIDEVIMGNVGQPMHAANIARVISLKAGLPDSVPAFTVHRNCASGMQSIATAMDLLSVGRKQVLIAGGTESMSRVPLFYPFEAALWFGKLSKARTLAQKLSVLSEFKLSYFKPHIGLEKGLTDPVCGLNMGHTAENLALMFHITREQQDAFALESHEKALAARNSARLSDEMMGLPSAGYQQMITEDDGPRDGITLESLQKLKPYFNRDTGTVTVGNACPITDGAAALMLMKEETARERGFSVLGYIRDYAEAALPGRIMGLGPVFATHRLLMKTGISMNDFDLIELNEAFAAQVLANETAFDSESFAREHLNRDSKLGCLDRSKLNVNGGAIALGHPVGTSGTRIVLTLLKELKRRNLNLGLATLCIGGGQGFAMAVEVA